MRNILLLEDDVIIALSIIQTIKANCDGQIHHALTATAAMELARKHTIDLLITDIGLGTRIDGIDVAQQLYKLYGLSILFLTSYSDEETLKRASKLNMIGYLVKPFREQDLIAQMRLAHYQYTKDEDLFVNMGAGYRYSFETQELLKDGECIRLTAKEHRLFLALLNAQGKIVSFSYIDDLLWPDKSITTGARRQLVFRLKGKIPGLALESISNVGYLLKI